MARASPFISVRSEKPRLQKRAPVSAQAIEQGKQLGIEQGRHEGIREAQIQFLRHLLVSRRYSVQELHDLTQALLELIEELLKQSLHPSKDQS